MRNKNAGIFYLLLHDLCVTKRSELLFIKEIQNIMAKHCYRTILFMEHIKVDKNLLNLTEENL